MYIDIGLLGEYRGSYGGRGQGHGHGHGHGHSRFNFDYTVHAVRYAVDIGSGRRWHHHWS